MDGGREVCVEDRQCCGWDGSNPREGVERLAGSREATFLFRTVTLKTKDSYPTGLKDESILSMCVYSGIDVHTADVDFLMRCSDAQEPGGQRRG